MIAPTIEALAADFEGQIKITKLDIDDNERMASSKESDGRQIERPAAEWSEKMKKYKYAINNKLLLFLSLWQDYYY